MSKVVIRVKSNGWRNAEAKLAEMKGRLPGIANEELLKMSNEAIKVFQEKARGGGFGQRGGGPALVDIGNYVSSWRAESIGDLMASIGPTGANKNMSNEALSELLEYGTSRMEAIPHVRGIIRWVDTKGGKKLGKAIAAKLFGD